MNWQKHRLALASVALVVLVLGLVFSLKKRDERLSGTAEQSESSLPDVDTDAVTELAITRPGQPEVRLVKNDGTWRLVAPVEAAVDANAVSTALEKIGSLEFVSIAATNAVSHERLEVDDAHAVHVVAKAGDRTVADLRVGAYRGGNTMVRVGGGNDVVAVRGSIKYAFNRELREWRDRNVVQVDPTEVRAIAFQNDQGAFRFVRNDAGEWVQAPGERAIAGFQASKVDGIVAGLARLRAADFAAPDAGDVGLDTPRATATLSVQRAAEGDAGTPTAETITLRLGAARGDQNEAYLQREGDPVVYVVAGYTVDKIRVNAESFTASAPAAEPPAAPPSPGGLPEGLPPEVMQQLQRQLMQQGMGGH